MSPYVRDNSHTVAYALQLSLPRAGSGVVRLDPLHFLARCHTRRLNQV